METNLDDIKHIRSMMERSSKFLSLSGISGISAGIIALVGAMVAYLLMHGQLSITGTQLYDFLILAVLVLLAASASGLFFSMRKAKKNGSKFWAELTWNILKDFCVPMIVGGLFCIILIYQNSAHLIASAMLIFYGLALIAAGSRTYRDVRYLGACEIILGFLAGIFIYNGLLFWALGFGVLHIVYGIIMYCKYDKRSDKNI